MDRISEFATEFEVEYVILEAVADGLQTPSTINERVLSNIRALSADDDEAVSAAIDRLVEKQLLERDGDTIHFKSS